MQEVVKIDINKIIPNKSQPRLEFFDESIEGLAESIKENGLLQPITVRENENGYELIAGERRLRAHKLIGKTEIEAIVLDKTDEESAKLALIENIQRENLNAVETAMAMRKIMEEDDLTQDELAKRLGYKQSTVANKLRLLKLPDYIKNAVAQGTLTERHARALLLVPSEKLEEVFNVIVTRKYNVAKTEEYIKTLFEDKKIKGVGGSALIALNTFKKSYEMCKNTGLDIDYNTTEYDDYVKVTIKIKK